MAYASGVTLLGLAFWLCHLWGGEESLNLFAHDMS